MRPIFKTIVKDILVLSAQAVAFRLAAPQDQQHDVILGAVHPKGGGSMKAIPGESEVQALPIACCDIS
jgi:hypothetical protein